MHFGSKLLSPFDLVGAHRHNCRFMLSSCVVFNGNFTFVFRLQALAYLGGWRIALGPSEIFVMSQHCVRNVGIGLHNYRPIYHDL